MVKLSRGVSDLPDVDIVPRSAPGPHDPLPIYYGIVREDETLKDQIAEEESEPLPFTDDEDS